MTAQEEIQAEKMQLDTSGRAAGFAAFLRAIALVSPLLLPPAASAVDLWAAPAPVCDACSIPQEAYKYLDANTACVAESPPFQEDACYKNARNYRNAAGPQTQSECDVDIECWCGFCEIGSNHPTLLTVYAGRLTSKRVQTCPSGTTPQGGRCDQDTAKGKGPCRDCELAKANPVNAASGNKYQGETAYRAASGGLELVLFYNSQAGSTYFRTGAFGTQWSARYLTAVRDSAQGIVALNRGDGRELEFRTPPSGNIWLHDADIADKLEKLVDGWRYTAAEADEVELYDAGGKLLSITNRAGLQQVMTYSTASTPASIAPEAGLLITVTDPFGRQLNFTYNAQKRINKMTDPAASEYLFEYDGPSGPAAAKNLTKVTFPDTKTRVYFYSEAAQINGGASCSSPSPVLVNALTGLNDESNNRYATWTYDCQARVTSSQHALGVELYSFDYGTGAATVVLDPRNTSRTVGLQRILGVAKGSGTTQPAASGQGTISNAATYDANGNPATRTDFNGNRTNYAYDLARNLETLRTEGLTSSGGTTPQTRTISTAWDANFRLPTQIAEPLRITTNVYDPDGSQCGARGALCSRSIQATTDASGAQGFSATPTGSPRI
jgi:YD repeat-containing protein